MEENERGSSLEPRRWPGRRATLLLAGACLGLGLIVISSGFLRTRRVELDQKPVTLPSPFAWQVPAPTIRPGRLQQILKSVTLFDSKLRALKTRTEDWQDLMGRALDHAQQTVIDLQQQSKGTSRLRDQVKVFVNTPGPMGPVGNPGPDGRQGPPGGVGEDGKQGPAGFVGAGGAMGSAGPIGAVGRIGYPGKAGQEGKSGRAGTPGAPGFPGQTGLQGLRGSEGKKGYSGLGGPRGMDVVGIAGIQGIPGPPGKIGRPGPPGPEGSEGLQGNIGIRGKWGFPGTQGIYGEVQGQIWDPLTWNYGGPESPRTVGRRDGGGGWNEYAGSPSFQAKRGPRPVRMSSSLSMLAQAKRLEAGITHQEGVPSLYPLKGPKVVFPSPKAHPQSNKRVGCEGSTSVEDVRNDSLFVDCNSMARGAAIELNGMHVSSVGQKFALRDTRRHVARDIHKAMKTFQTIAQLDAKAKVFAHRKVINWPDIGETLTITDLKKR